MSKGSFPLHADNSTRHRNGEKYSKETEEYRHAPRTDRAWPNGRLWKNPEMYLWLQTHLDPGT